MNTLSGEVLTFPKMSGSISAPKSLIGNIGAKIINIGGGDGISADDIASCAIRGDIRLDVATIRQGAFWGNDGITSVDAPNATTIEEYAFTSCEKIVKINIPEVTAIGERGLSYCYALAEINFPKLKTLGPYGFYYCSSVQGDVVLPVLTALPTQSCYRMSGITSIDLPVCKSIGVQAFRYCSKLDTIILRSTTLCTLANANALYNMPFASGWDGGKLYAPASLVDSYKSAAGWATVLGHSTNEIRALEDYTVDGTITGKLDTSKI